MRTLLDLTLVLAAMGLAVAQAPRQNPQPSTPSSAADEASLRKDIELLRSDMQTRKEAIMAEAMQFTGNEGDKFWPIYRDFQSDLAKLSDQRLALVKKYADQYETLTNDQADVIAKGVMRFEEQRNDLKKKYYERIKAEAGAKTAARFLQVETWMEKLIDVQIGSQLPIVK